MRRKERAKRSWCRGRREREREPGGERADEGRADERDGVTRGSTGDQEGSSVTRAAKRGTLQETVQWQQ